MEVSNETTILSPFEPVDRAGIERSCPSGAVEAPAVVDTWSPPLEAASITLLSWAEIGEVFVYDPQAPLDVQEVSRHQEEGVAVIDLTYASLMGGCRTSNISTIAAR